MPYQNNIPRPTDQLNVSQGDIQQNFLEIYNWVAINHAQFNTANSGKHTQVTLPVNAAPTPTAANEVNIYSRVSANTNKPEITWQNQNNGTIIEMTAGRVEPNFPRNGWSRIPSGLLIKWGFDTSTGTGYTVTFPVNINGVLAPVFSTVPFSIIAIPSSNAATAITVLGGSFTTTTFNVNTFQTNTSTPSASPFFYVALGT